MDIFSAIIVVVPLILPIAEQFGVNPLHLAIVFLTNLAATDDERKKVDSFFLSTWNNSEGDDVIEDTADTSDDSQFVCRFR